MAQTGYPEPGYTQTPNLLFDEQMRLMGEAELRVVLCAVRKTFGYHKQRDPISLTQFQHMTGLSRQGVLDGIDAAIARGVMEQVGTGARGVGIYALCVLTTGQASGLVKPVDQSTQLTSTGQASRPELVKPVDTQKKGNKERKKDSVPAAQDASSEKLSTIPAKIMNPLKDAIVIVLGWQWATMTKAEKGSVQAAAKSFAEVNATPDDVLRCHAECEKRGWKNYGAVALTKVLSDVRKVSPAPASNGNGNHAAAQRRFYANGGWIAPERLAPDGTIDGQMRPDYMVVTIPAAGTYDGVALAAGEKIYQDGTIPFAWLGLED